MTTQISEQQTHAQIFWSKMIKMFIKGQISFEEANVTINDEMNEKLISENCGAKLKTIIKKIWYS